MNSMPRVQRVRCVCPSHFCARVRPRTGGWHYDVVVTAALDGGSRPAGRRPVRSERRVIEPTGHSWPAAGLVLTPLERNARGISLEFYQRSAPLCERQRLGAGKARRDKFFTEDPDTMRRFEPHLPRDLKRWLAKPGEGSATTLDLKSGVKKADAIVPS